MYSAEAEETARVLSHCAQTATERKVEAREAAKAKRRAAKASMRPPNPFTNFPQPDWKDAGASQLPPIPSVASLNRKPWLPAVRNVDESSPVEQLKRSLAGSFTRVVALFRKWDVNCDGNVSIHELRDAIGALRLHDTATTWDTDTLNALFRALDTNGNGSIDFQELHHALRRYNPPPISPGSPSPGAGSSLSGEIILELPRRHEKKKTQGSGKELEAVANVKRMLAFNQSRVIDLFKRWDVDMDANITPHELRRALAALSIEIDQRALKLLFKQIDTDGSGEISFRELNAVLRRQVDFDAGNGERFDAATGTYTTGYTAVKQKKRRGADDSGAGGHSKAAPTLPPLGVRIDMHSHVDNLTPRFVGGGDDFEALAKRREKQANAAADRDVDDYRQQKEQKEKAARSYARDGVREKRTS